MQVTRLTTYPVKSMAGTRTDHAVVTPQGLHEDRRWALVDPDGRPVTARECHALLGVTAEPTGDGAVRLVTREGAECLLPTVAPDAPTVEVGFSRVSRLALGDAGASTWLSDLVGRPLRFVRLADPSAREIGASHGGRPGESMSLADAGPILLVSQTSVQRLRDWVLEESQEEWLDPEEAVERFRPNVVVDGEEPFAEDGWQRLRIGGTTYRQGELCDRCVMTTIALDSLETTAEPIRTLARHRRWDATTWFGVRLVPELGAEGPAAEVRVGDTVAPL
ncbi:MOSC domain-containing protein [Nocardioides sp. HDW12B]|uniref:MOSC domain-containing protein n=1 Tax=Nocardioides sp. HDW12B TaxID=2714939 RepID=UPI00140DA556|nr:MOSC N-terminal beta barrel domain-containing protein [Nocardioides sp. HDW12B]QIK67468.1 MOSC domain-containing protein [Nocardioides sp. HDW12B]